jgi:hypothetical protein
MEDLLVVTSKRVDRFEETGEVGANKDTCDRDCADVSVRGGHFSMCQKIGR